MVSRSAKTPHGTAGWGVRQLTVLMALVGMSAPLSADAAEGTAAERPACCAARAGGDSAGSPRPGAPACCLEKGAAGPQRAEAPWLASLAGLPAVGWVFDTSPYPPRWYCGNWNAAIGWLHIVSDLFVWAAYTGISSGIFYLIHKHKAVPFKGLLRLFCLFIFCCGVTHLMEAVIFWWPAYGLAGVLKGITAVVSVVTAAMLIPAVPQLLSLRSPMQLEQEVTLRNQEANLAREEASKIVEASPAGIVMIDTGGRIVRVNAVTEKLFGYDRHEMLGQPVEILLPERYRADHPGHVKRFFTSPETRRMGAGRELFARSASGREFPIEIGLNPVETSSGRYVLAAVVDISSRKALEGEIELNAKLLTATNKALQSSNKDLEQFAYIASHDLQEPLRKISSYCELLKEEQRDRLDGEALSYLDVAIDGARRSRKMVRELLEFSRITTRGKPMEPTSAEGCLDEALSDLELAIEDSGGRVTHDPMPEVIADASQLSRVFLNLVGNALKYRGELPPEVHVGCRREGEEYEISVSDNGIGIDPKHQDKVFGIFQRLHTRKEYPGSGIGLAHCKKIVERFGGKVWFESVPGEGSTFFFTIRPAPDSEPPCLVNQAECSETREPQPVG